MSKYLKSFNKETQEWEIISSPDISVIQQISGETISDTNIQVSEPHYLESGETTSNLIDELRGINEDISKLQSNVSWLAEHGGGGSGGGGGTASFNISIISPVISEGRAYVNEDKLTVQFMITGGTATDICQYSYTFDSKEATPYVEALANSTINIELDLSSTGMTHHTLIINAINPYGMNILPVSFSIYKSTLKCYFDVETAGEYYKNEIFYILQNDRYGNMPFIVDNGIEGAKVTMKLKCNEKEITKEFTNVSVGRSKVNVSFWDFNITPTPGNYYLITINAQSTQGEHTATVPEFLLRVSIINPSELTITMGVNGEGGDTTVKAQLESGLIYNFRVFAPASINYTYYSAKIVNNGISYLILGKYYDDDTKASSGSTYSDNDYTSVGNMISEQYPLSSNKFSVGDKPKLYVKVWDINNKDTYKEISREIEIVTAENGIFPRQYGLRTSQSSHVGSGDTMIASWNRSNVDSTSKNKWTSSINNYSPILSGVSSSVVIDMNVKNGNDNSGIQTASGTPYLRLENHAYAEIDFSNYSDEIKAMFNSSNISSQGCSITISVLPDIHTNTKHTIFLWGENDGNGAIAKGIKIDVDKIYWAINEKTSEGSTKTHTLTCPLVEGEITVITFSIVKNSEYSSTVRIYKNGIVNSAIDIYQVDLNYSLPNKAYLGCDIISNNPSKHADTKIYELSIYTKSLNDLENTINSKNARIIDNITSLSVTKDYESWKINNLLISKNNQPESALFSNGEYIKNFNIDKIQKIAAQSEIPIIYLSFNEEFTEEFFYKKYTTDIPSQEFNCKVNYCYKEGTSTKTISFNGKVTLQGTTTLGYRIKNLELYVNDYVDIDGEQVVKLFQPKKEWFPESQFTLKADVVDSSHANNAVIGEWVNNANTIFEPNPAMAAFTNETRPKEVDDKGNEQKHYSVKEKRDVNYDEDVTIKHTLEGFPILLFIKFAGKDPFNLIGIYSFNLGRYSYFNMGMKFLDKFSRYTYTGEGATAIKEGCPKIINYYKVKQKLGDIDSNNIYSFEFGNAGNENVAEHPVWTQYEETVLQHYGEFKYPKNVQTTDAIWVKLRSLFEATAMSEIDSYYGTKITTFNKIYSYKYINDKYEKDGSQVITQDANHYNLIASHLNIPNAAAYFVVANAFGMFDSLGKNLTLRSWDGGLTWYTAFYDMDTGLALVNSGAEDGPVDSSIDKVTLITNLSAETSIINTTYHYEESKYAAYRSKLWGLLRCYGFLYKAGKLNEPYYESIWNKLRQKGGLFEKSTNFTDLMASRIGKCGEMIYDYDYYNKYILDSTDEGTATAAIDFLHGTRIDFVKDWLKKHFYYLDGMFDSSEVTATTYSYSDSPYNTDKLTFVVNYPSAKANLKYTLQATTPSFIGITIGSDKYKKFYIGETNKDTIIFFPNSTSSNSQLTIKGSSLLSKIDGLQGGFMGISSTNAIGVAYSLNELNASSSSNLQTEPIGKEGKSLSNIAIKDNISSLESVNLSSTKLADSTKTYSLDLENLKKLLYIDISNSDVKTFVLPTSLIQSLNIKNSKITNFDLKRQNSLINVDFTGCNMLINVDVEECDKLTSINLTNKPNLTDFKCIKCSNVSSITLDNCSALKNVEINNNANLKEIIINNCNPQIENINIVNCKNLQRIVFTNTSTSSYMQIDTGSAQNISSITIDNSSNFIGFKIGGTDIPQYSGETLLDFSKFTNLEELSMKNHNAKYVRVKNIENSPLKITSSNLEGCNSLIRILGHIGINSNGIFYKKYDFYLNEQDNNIKPEDTPTFVNNSGYTNVTICCEDISGCFAYTSCKNSDVYFVFQRCNSGTTNISSLFRNATKLTINNLSKNLFYHCRNIKNMDYLFADTQISADNNTSSATCIDNTFLENHIDLVNMKTFNYVFPKPIKTICNSKSGGSEKYFFPSGNNIEEIISFNIIPIGSSGGTSRFIDNQLLVNLNKLKRLRSSFNTTDFDHIIIIGFNNGQIFSNNKLIEEIRDCFNGIQAQQESTSLRISDLFGLNTDTLTKLCNSFRFDYGSLNIYIGNSFLQNIPCIKYIMGGITENDYNYINISNHSILYGEGLNKYINHDDCDGENFPYKIFSGLTNLTQVTGFFREMKQESGYSGYTDITYYPYLPCSKDDSSKSVFANMGNLKNFSYGFSEMKLKYYLAPDGFKDCTNIQYIPYLFSDKPSSSDNDNYGKQNTIPYHFLYNGDNNTIVNMEGCFSNTNAANISGYTCSNEVMNKYLFEETNDTINNFKYKWNPYISDNTIEFINKFNTKFENICTTSGLTGTTMYSYYDDNNVEHIVDTEEEVPTGKTYTEVICYVKNDESGERIFPYIIKEFTSSHIQSGISSGDIKNYLGENTDSYVKYAIKTNYFCAPDVFNYCQNVPDLNMTRVFSNSSIFFKGTTTEDDRIKGFRGKIPPMFFQEVNKVYSLSNIFYNCRHLFPYYWGITTTSGIISGTTYPIELFINMPNLTNISNMFSNSYIWGLTFMNKEMMTPIKNTLSNISGLWDHCTWGTTEIDSGSTKIAIYQLPEDYFKECGQLANISSLFSHSNIRIHGNHFTATYNPNLTDCSSFMGNASGAKGTVPTLWMNFPKLVNYSGAFYKIPTDPNIITNYNDIPDNWK